MGFIDAYKRLEKLCGEIYGSNKPIGCYIDEMKNNPMGSQLINGWDDDLKKLKHYRWVRNQIAHEVGCTEQNMSTRSDEAWIKNFHNRIMNQTDPLALYNKILKKRKNKTPDTDDTQPNREATAQFLGCFTAGLVIVLIIAISILAIIS